MRRSEDFRRTVRHGVRVGRPTVVVHAWRQEVVAGPGPSGGGGSTAPTVGFVVSKAIGAAVSRNRVKRRLRHLARRRLGELPAQTRLVVRALPPAAGAGAGLESDLDAAWTAALAKLDRR